VGLRRGRGLPVNRSEGYRRGTFLASSIRREFVHGAERIVCSARLSREWSWNEVGSIDGDILHHRRFRKRKRAGCFRANIVWESDNDRSARALGWVCYTCDNYTLRKFRSVAIASNASHYSRTRLPGA